MKTTDKIKFMAISALIGVSAQNASAGSAELYNCMAANHQSFSFQMESVPAEFESAVYAGLATDLHGMNVAIKSLPVEILAHPIHTRTIVGFKYSFALPSGAEVVVTDITSASFSFQDQLGTKGQVKLSDGQILDVVCK